MLRLGVMRSWPRVLCEAALSLAVPPNRFLSRLRRVRCPAGVPAVKPVVVEVQTSTCFRPHSMNSGQISRRCLSSLAASSTRPVCARVPNRALIEVSGGDTGKLLNGIVTSTVPWPPANNGFYSSFLHAQARCNSFVSP